MKPVLFSVSYAGLWGQQALTLEQFIPHARKLGFEGVELMGKRPHLSPLDWMPDNAAALGELCSANSMEVSCVAAYTNFTGGAEAAEVPFVDMQIQYVESLAALAQSLGCTLVRAFTAYERDDMPFAEQWNRVIEAMRQCCERSEPYEVTIGIQNHHDIAVHSKSLLELLHDIDRPNCKLMLDPWSPCLRGEELFETAKAMAPHVVYTTLADYVRLPRSRYRPDLINYTSAPDDMVRAVPMGEGDLDSLSFVKGLKAGGFDGPIAYEMCSPIRGGGSNEKLDDYAKTFLKWLQANELCSAPSSRRGRSVA